MGVALKPKLQELTQNLDQVLHTNDWTLEVMRWPIALDSGLSQLKPLADKSLIRLISVDLPKWEVSPVQVLHRGYIFQLPSIWDTPRSLTTIFLETIDKPVFKLLEAWREVVAQTSWAGSSSDDYQTSSIKADLRIIMYNRQQNPVLEYNIYGVFPINVDFGQLVGDKGADIFRINVTWSYDYYFAK